MTSPIGRQAILLSASRIRPTSLANFVATPALPSSITASGGANGTRFDSTGTLVAATAPRFDYDPATLAARGLLVEVSATNGIRNSSAAGALAGSPGTVPTNWAATSTGGVITRTVVGSGSENGIPYVDIRWQFSGAGLSDVAFEQGTAVAAANGQTWTSSRFLSIAAGSLTNISSIQQITSEFNNVGGFLAATAATVAVSAGSLPARRAQLTRVFNNAATAYMGASVRVNASGAADITIRYGLPQAEQAATASSPILTTVAALARSADAVAFVDASPAIIVQRMSIATGVVDRVYYAPGAFPASFQAGYLYQQAAKYPRALTPAEQTARLVVGSPL